MTIFEFAEEISEMTGGDRAYYRFEKQELSERCREISEAHRKVEEEIA